MKSTIIDVILNSIETNLELGNINQYDAYRLKEATTGKNDIEIEQMLSETFDIDNTTLHNIIFMD